MTDKTIITREAAELVRREHEDFIRQVCARKYQAKAEDDTLLELSFEEVIDRVSEKLLRSRYFSAGSADFRKAVRNMLLGRRFIFAGSILGGYGLEKSGRSYSNCYLTKIENDSIEAIFEACKRLARTYSYRGGSGIDITVLRPNNAVVHNAAIASSGAVSFMPMISQTTESIGQNGRRGASVITIDVRHPDTPRFIRSKSHPEEVFGRDALTGKVPDIYGANISVKLTEEFMQAVWNDAGWTFRFPYFDRIFGAVAGADKRQVSLHLTDAVWGQVRGYDGCQAALLLPPRNPGEDEQECQGTLRISSKHSRTVVFHMSSSIEDPVFGVHDFCDRVMAAPKGNLAFKLLPMVGTRCQTGEEARKVTQSIYDTLWDGDYEKWAGTYGQVLRPYDTLPASEVMWMIAESAHACGDPGVLFIDTVHHNTPGTYIDPNNLKTMGINPCGEQPLAPWNNCLLGAMVLWKYVREPYTQNAWFDSETFLADVELAVWAMNAVSDDNLQRHPLKEQRDADAYSRRIGIEHTGLADMLAMLNMRYDSEEARRFVGDILRGKALAEITASSKLAQEFGCCEAFNVPGLSVENPREAFLNCPYIINLRLPEETRQRIREYGLRNTAFNTVGPCGSISIMANNCSSGIEPIFKMSYLRETRLAPGRQFEFIHKPVLDFLLDTEAGRRMLAAGVTVEDLKKALHYQEADEIDYLARIKMQQVVQRATDASISSTINLPCEATVEDILNIYVAANQHLLKGITVFRDGCKKGVLSAKKEEEEPTPESADEDDDEGEAAIPTTNYQLVERELLDVEDAERHRVMWKGTKLYVIVSLDEEGQPVEIFAKLPQQAGVNGGGQYSEEAFRERTSNWDALCRTLSMLLRVGMPLERVVRQLDKASYSMVDAPGIIARILKRYMTVDLDEDEDGELDDAALEAAGVQVCPECQARAYVRENGCTICRACGYTTCG